MIWATVDELRMRPARMAAAIRRDWLRIVAVVLAATALAAAAAWLLPDRYEGRARILVETGEGAGLAAEQSAAQVDVVASADILETVARSLDLAARPEFASAPDLLSRMLVLVGMRSDPDAVPAGEQAVRTVRGGLDVNASGDGRIITVAFRSADAALAAAVPNAIADRYVALQQAARKQAEPQAAEELAAKIEKLRADVKALDARLAALRQGGGKAADPAAAQRRAELQAQLARIEAGRSGDEARAGELREAIGDAAALSANSDMQASEAAAPLLERDAALRAEISDLSATLLDNHPRMKALRAQLAETDAAIGREARKVLAGIEADAKAAASQAGKVSAELDAIGAAADDAAGREAELRALDAQSAAQHRLLDAETVRQRDAAAGTSRFYLPADARVFARAAVPARPVSPNRPLLVGAVFALSLLAMLAASVLRRRDGAAAAAAPAELPAVDEVEMPAIAGPEPEPVPAPAPASWSRSDAVRAARDAEASPLQPEPFPATLVMRRSPPRVAPEAQPAPVRRTIGEIDVAMAAERLIAGGATRAVFVSPEGDEGAAASVLVARDVADAGLRVVLLDLTASGAASRPMLEGTVYTGITNLLVSEAQFGDIIHNDLYSGCHVIPVGTADPVRAMRAAERLPIILDSLTTAYDLVVVECGATDAEGIRRLVVDDTSVLLAAIEPSDEIAEVALELDRHGLGHPIIVSPGEALPPRRPDRSVA